MSDDPEIPALLNSLDDTSLAFSYHPAWGFVGVSLGVALLIAVSFAESLSLQDAPGLRIIYAEQGEPIWDDTIPIGVRHVPMSEFPTISDTLESLRESVSPTQAREYEAIFQSMGIEKTEVVICANLDTETFESLLASGRLPEPGEPEVLSGIYTRLDSFTLDDQQFEVVGRITSSAAGLHFAYLLPRDDSMESAFFTHPDATVGWLDLDARDEIQTLDPSQGELKNLNLASNQIPAKPAIAIASMLGLTLVAFFGMLAHLSTFRILHSGRCGPLRPALRVFLQHSKLVLGMHVLLYGTFFGMMIFSYTRPVAQMWTNNFIVSQFEQGSVAHIGEAYASGSIPRAAWATFFNNFVLQTLLMTVLVSLLLPMIGILKTMLSFSLVGFGMVPSWAGMTGLYTFHSITLTLEFEAYIFACICVAYFWGNLVVGAINKDFSEHFRRSSYTLLSGTLLAGIMLAFAGIYEAVTLILARS